VEGADMDGRGTISERMILDTKKKEMQNFQRRKPVTKLSKGPLPKPIVNLRSIALSRIKL
jgi:hypothetical protein